MTRHLGLRRATDQSAARRTNPLTWTQSFQLMYADLVRGMGRFPVLITGFCFPWFLFGLRRTSILSHRISTGYRFDAMEVGIAMAGAENRPE
jgi:hypothetical protein